MNRAIFFLLLCTVGVALSAAPVKWTRDEWRACRQGVIQDELFIARTVPRYQSWTNDDCTRLYIVRMQHYPFRRVRPTPRWIDTNALVCPLGITNFPSR